MVLQDGWFPKNRSRKLCCFSPLVHCLCTSSPCVFQDLLDALLALGIPVQASLLLLAPLLQLRLHLPACLLKLPVPILEGLLCLILGLKHAQQVLGSERIDRLGLVERVGRTPVVLE